MRFRALLLPALILALAVPARAQVFADAFNGKRDAWELRLKQGDAVAVRQEIEAFLTVQGANASPSNYGDQHAIVGARGLEARACVASGDWEAALANLQKASATAGENLSATEVSFAKLQADHAEKLTLWKGELGDAQAKLDQLNAAPGLTEDQMKLKGQLQTFVAEHQSSIQHSESALKAMDGAYELDERGDRHQSQRSAPCLARISHGRRHAREDRDHQRRLASVRAVPGDLAVHARAHSASGSGAMRQGQDILRIRIRRFRGTGRSGSWTAPRRPPAPPCLPRG